MSVARLIFIESNTSGTGRLFARAAASQGFVPVLLASNPAKYAYATEDGLDVVNVDTQRGDAVLEACGRIAAESELAGVTSSSEYFIELAATIARELRLPGPSPLAINQCRDKHRQRICLQQAGIGVPAFRSANSTEEAVAAANEIGLPVVVKPVSGSGSVGVKFCDDIRQAAAHADELLAQRENERGAPVPGYVLVEEVAIGAEYSVESFDGEIIGITRKHLGSLPYFVETGHDYPAVLSNEEESTIRAAVAASLKALGLTWGPTHCELRLTSSGPKIIEVNPRLAGGYIPELVRLAQGVDLIAETIRAVSGMQARLQKRARRYASLRFILPGGEGKLAAVEGLEDARSISGIENAALYARPGDHVQVRGDFRDRLGHVIAVTDNASDSGKAAELARDKIRLLLEP